MLGMDAVVVDAIEMFGGESSAKFVLITACLF